MSVNIKYKLGDILRHNKLGSIGIVVNDPKYINKLVIQIHPFIFGEIIEEDWDIIQDVDKYVFKYQPRD